MPTGMDPTYYEWAKMLICEDFGERLFVYDDATGEPVKAGDTLVGNPSIGYGRNLAERGLTTAEAMVMLHGDLSVAQRAVDMFVGSASAGLAPIRKAVLMSMAHHLGGSELMKLGRLREAILAGDWPRAAYEIVCVKIDNDLQVHYNRLSRMMHDAAFHPA